MEKEKFWQQCLDKIKEKISDQAFETWFQAVDIISLNQEELNLQVPNEFHLGLVVVFFIKTDIEVKNYTDKFCYNFFLSVY